MTETKQAPDLVLYGGSILTGELAGSDRPTALAVAGGLVSAIGGEEIRELAGPATRLIDLGGGTVLPGINDAHLHLMGTAMSLFGYVDIGAAAAADWEHVAKILRESPVPADGWIRAHGWDSSTLGPGGTQAVLDCRQDVPVVAFDQTGHQLLANATALRLAAITAETPDPAGGVIERFPDGALTGLLQDGASTLMNNALPDVPRPVLHAALLKTQALLHSQGITSLTEPGLGPGSPGLFDGSGTTAALQLLGDMAVAKELTLRIAVLMLFAGTGGVSAAAVEHGLASSLATSYSDRGIDPRQLAIAGVKIFSDGIPRSNTAWMSEPYGAECTHGHLVVVGATDEERVAELGRILKIIDDAGLQAGIHATGDAATETAIELLGGLGPARAADPRHYIIHGAFSSNATLDTMAAAGIGYSTNPAIRATAGDLMRDVMGDERFARHQPLHSALSAGVHMNLASDSPVTSTDWRRTVIAAVRRSTPARPGLENDPERITSLDALAAMTSLPAWQDHAETYKGTLLPGMVADLCVLDGPWPDDHRIEELLQRQVVLTIAGGRVVHELTEQTSISPQ
ncbi:MAG: amidohydrolase [Specibacter sp.]